MTNFGKVPFSCSTVDIRGGSKRVQSAMVSKLFKFSRWTKLFILSVRQPEEYVDCFKCL